MNANGTYSGLELGAVNGVYNGVNSGVGNGTVSNETKPLNIPLLDLFPGAAAAYSLRKLRTNYNGPAIRVRRSSDNSELDIGFDSVGNLNENSLTTFVGINSGFVTIWYDQSNNGNNFLQTSNINQPEIVSSGIITRSTNNKPTINFSGNTIPYFFNSPSNFLSNQSTPLSIFCTWRIFDYSSSNSGVFAPATQNSLGLEILQTSVINRRSLLRINNVIKNDNAATDYQLWDDSISTNTSIIITNSITSVCKNGKNILLTDVSGISSLSTGITNYSMGRYSSTFYMSGDIQEVIIWFSNQLFNRTDISTNINKYYKLN